MKKLQLPLSKKNYLIGAIFLGLPFFTYAQSDLQRQFSLEASIISLGVAYEQPLLKNTEAELSVGVTDFFRSEMGYSINSLTEKIFHPIPKLLFVIITIVIIVNIKERIIPLIKEISLPFKIKYYTELLVIMI
ncbi:exported hypothetical protein [Capnocytophaga canimorsus]|uniref:Uncharacterized protein n=1 Tax=Capnocytophaga canimorsus TaxID=28188 RepID=A0A0B7HQA4_9FLAO|nr:hypothetical protein [Capnocytophaga canimorsus]CEN40789.1 exported hypothetical protein [Capnocytophaga canimorsus]